MNTGRCFWDAVQHWKNVVNMTADLIHFLGTLGQETRVGEAGAFHTHCSSHVAGSHLVASALKAFPSIVAG